jgi:pimeloyl-ACP methyl ester carboxylesterase
MIHGMYSDAWCWEPFKGYFEKKGYRCRTPTLRHHDRLPEEPPDVKLGKTGLADYAADLEDYIRGLPDKPILFGHSMGGILAQILAARGLARRLVLLAPAPPSGINILKWSVIRSFAGVLQQWGFWHKPHRLSFNAAVYAPLNKLPAGQQQSIYSRLVPESGRVICEIGLWFLDPKRASRVDDRKVTCPVLIVTGSQDRMTPASVARNIHRKYRRVAEFKCFSGHGHWLIGEAGWTGIADFISRWLEDTD